MCRLPHHFSSKVAVKGKGKIVIYLVQHYSIRQTFICCGLAVLLLLTTLLQSALLGSGISTVLAESGLKDGNQARVANTDGDKLRLRAEPDAKSATILNLDENWLVTIKGGPFKDSQDNSFYKVEWSNRTGYAMAQYLVYAGKAAPANTKNLAIGGQVRVSGTDGDGVRMRQQPNSSASTLTILNCREPC